MFNSANFEGPSFYGSDEIDIKSTFNFMRMKKNIVRQNTPF